MFDRMRRRQRPEAKVVMGDVAIRDGAWVADPGMRQAVRGWLADGSKPTMKAIRRWQDRLDAPHRQMHGNSLGVVPALTFDSDVGVFFNRDLAFAMASALAPLEEDTPESLRFYLLENAVERIVRCWDYLFQYLIQHVLLHERSLPSRASRDDLVTLAGWNVDFEATGDVTSLRPRRKPPRRAIEDMVRRKRETGYVRSGKRADQFFDAMRRVYARAAWIEELKTLKRHPATRRIHEIRDHLMHVGPLSTSLGIDDRAMASLPASGLQVGPEPRRSAEEVRAAIVDAHRVLVRAVTITREVIHNGLVPNRKESEGHLFHVHGFRCPHCGARLAVPCPDPISERFGHRVCPTCGLWSAARLADLHDAIPTTELGHDALVLDYLTVAGRLAHRLDPKWATPESG